MTGLLLKIEHLEVRYGDLIGVSDVSLEVPEGSVVALLGSNGGGKTTTLNAIAGLIPLHAGSITFKGEEIGGQSAFAIVRKGLARISHSVEAHRGANQRKFFCEKDFAMIQGMPRCRQSVAQSSLILEGWKAGLWKRPLMVAW